MVLGEHKGGGAVVYPAGYSFKLLPAEGGKKNLSFDSPLFSIYLWRDDRSHMLFSASHMHGYTHLGAARETVASPGRWRGAAQ